MGTFEVKGQKPVPAAARKPASELTRALASGIREARDNPAATGKEYLKLAFTNPYNLSLLGGMLAAAGLTLNPLLAVIALGTEALWLLYAPSSRQLKSLLWDPRLQEVRLEVERQDREERTKTLAPEDKQRVEDLVSRQLEIDRLAEQNPSFTGDLLRSELVKTHRLVSAFVDLAVTCSRYETYLASVDLSELERDRSKFESRVRTGKPEDPATTLAKKNFEVILKRLEKVHEIREYLGLARSQLDLIENSFELIADQIVTMQSPQELSGQLDELLDGVESIRQTAVDTEKILSGR